ncbi:OmpA family protein [Desulfogranum mediterraneum]|uniref:OmpA family protein n=1 Tax=Desulfogranum mediterraneum TaxID=160661 RepID=UPI0004169C85|nr:OmpA family protein [Desulfogranum mediterraneum]
MHIATRLMIASVFTGTVLLLAGCSSKPITPYSSGANTNMPEGKAIDYSTRQGSVVEEIGPSEEALDSMGKDGQAVGSFATTGDQNSEEYKKTYGRSSSQMQPIYFDFDQSTVRGDQIPQLEHNAEYLKANPSATVIVEGNSDFRGTNEYNLALGERRALSAKNYLIELGVEEYRVRTVSYGEERPLFTGDSDFDWSQNRRDDFVLE